MQKLRQINKGNHLIKLKYDTERDVYIVENRIKHIPNVHKKYTFDAKEFKEKNLAEKEFNAILSYVNDKIETEKKFTGLERNKWNKYTTSAFYS